MWASGSNRSPLDLLEVFATVRDMDAFKSSVEAFARSLGFDLYGVVGVTEHRRGRRREVQGEQWNEAAIGKRGFWEDEVPSDAPPFVSAIDDPLALQSNIAIRDTSGVISRIALLRSLNVVVYCLPWQTDLLHVLS